jgi:branched-chain amino acid transport system ATP-binding protein
MSSSDGDAPATGGLEIRNLFASYGKAVVLQGLSLSVRPGEIVGVAGPNGVGKTTLLRTISGLVTRSSDTLAFDGAPLPRDPVRTCAAGIIHVPEGRQLFAGLTVEENLRVGARGSGVRDFPAARDRVVAMFPAIEAHLRRKAGLLSGGQQQQVAIARGLIGQPKLLMIDELSLGLSPAAVVSISQIATAACREFGASLLWVDQNLTVLAKHCDRIVLLNDGVAADLELPDESSASATALKSVYF